MQKNILLVEPAYKTKYPPLGLMKISQYHKMKGDQVHFVKGCDKKVQYEYWDRIYISTLFTWTWKETVDTINFYRATLFGFTGKIYVGGILASLMPDELFNATGIMPVEGLLNNPSKIEQDDDIIIDNLPPDYAILKEVEKSDFEYENTNAYIGYTTRGCIRHCEFCAVSTFEPQYIPYVDIKSTIEEIKNHSGEKQNLVLMDNNVLASSRFDQIIDDIKSLGFFKGATFGKTKIRRIVDFNQGLDARLLTEDKMKRLAEIPLEPLRLAFDFIDIKDIYVRAIRLANKYGQKNISSYVLYNFNDTPEDFYERLRISVDLNEEFRKNSEIKTEIYSFPMRYIPLNAKSRDENTGNGHWNKKYLRGIQVILNVTKGPVMPRRQFFQQAFGRDIDEFKTILLMPSEFIRNRLVHDWRNIDKYEQRLMPYVREWMKTYHSLSETEKEKLTTILGPNDLSLIKKGYDNSKNSKICKLLRFHLEENEIVSRYKAT